jgi:hypothetical protein
MNEKKFKTRSYRLQSDSYLYKLFNENKTDMYNLVNKNKKKRARG